MNKIKGLQYGVLIYIYSYTVGENVNQPYIFHTLDIIFISVACSNQRTIEGKMWLSALVSMYQRKNKNTIFHPVRIRRI